jgi:hypothetical protein
MLRAVAMLSATVIVLMVASPVNAHELFDVNGKPITSHQHVWRQQGYGQDYRQGHSVNNSLGNITIWSPNTYNPYKAGRGLRFARPPIQLVNPKAGSSIPQFKNPSNSRYGQK